MHDLVMSTNSRPSPVMVAVTSGLINVEEEMLEAKAQANA